MWEAQDTRGNIHKLKCQILNDGQGKSYAAKLVGVAAGRPAIFELPRSGDIRVGSVWYDRETQSRQQQDKVLAISASARGKTGLLQVRNISDWNKDGVYDPSWSGPDGRQDLFWQPGNGLVVFKDTLTAGYAK